MPRKKTPLSLELLNERAQEDFNPTDDVEMTSREQRLLKLEEILDRPAGDTRSLNQAHVDALADSISVLGLITPLTVDRSNYLLAGGHRRESLRFLSVEKPERFEELFDEGIPVRIMDIDSQNDEVDALQIEVEENTQRRNFTPSEIRKAAEKLELAGYERLRGRPRRGQKSLKRALATVFRLSEDRIQRILNRTDEKGRRAPTFSPENAVKTLEDWLLAIRCSSSPNYREAEKHIRALIGELRSDFDRS